jgi:hypothetical protein
MELQIKNAGNSRGALEASTNGLGQGVLASATSGAGVEGESTSGAGLLGVADGPRGTALRTSGRSVFNGPTSFSRSGVVTISAGRAQATKSPINLGATSMVLATIQGNQPGIYVQGVTTVAGTRGSFTIHLNSPSPAKLRVAYLVVG